MSVQAPSWEEFAALVERVAELEARLESACEPRPAWLSVESAAAYLDCSPERLRKLAARRRIPFVQEAARCRLEFSRDDLDQWMRSRRVEASEEASE